LKILVSGFEPYGEMSVNPTQRLVEEVGSFGSEGVEIHPLLLPVNYDECVEKITGELDRLSPEAVISCGLYPGRTAVTPERVGLNVKDTMAEGPIADNRGRSPVDEPIDPDGPDALFSTLPYRKITEELLSSGIPAYVSNTAGTYICNNTLYGVLNHIRKGGLPTIGGFVHFPASTEMAVENPLQPSLPQDMLAEALRVIVGIVIQEVRERRGTGVGSVPARE
jgi:pyroglutamyl-peptidase